MSIAETKNGALRTAEEVRAHILSVTLCFDLRELAQLRHAGLTR